MSEERAGYITTAQSAAEEWLTRCGIYHKYVGGDPTIPGEPPHVDADPTWPPDSIVPGEPPRMARSSDNLSKSSIQYLAQQIDKQTEQINSLIAEVGILQEWRKESMEQAKPSDLDRIIDMLKEGISDHDRFFVNEEGYRLRFTQTCRTVLCGLIRMRDGSGRA